MCCAPKVGGSYVPSLPDKQAAITRISWRSTRWRKNVIVWLVYVCITNPAIKSLCCLSLAVGVNGQVQTYMYSIPQTQHSRSDHESVPDHRGFNLLIKGLIKLRFGFDPISGCIVNQLWVGEVKVHSTHTWPHCKTHIQCAVFAIQQWQEKCTLDLVESRFVYLRRSLYGFISFLFCKFSSPASYQCY